ncbi:MAG: hypothetical protein KGD63_04895 [Candidatus Lokiarchaeota archaeon]|nr:hypothetical protein [Candidatus Lokiarchaeota archaeon]
MKFKKKKPKEKPVQKISLLISIILISSVSGVVINSMKSTQSEDNMLILEDLYSALKTSQATSESGALFAFRHYQYIYAFLGSIHVLWFNIDRDIVNKILTAGVQKMIPHLEAIILALAGVLAIASATATILLTAIIVATIALWPTHMFFRGFNDVKIGVGVQILPIPYLYIYLDNSYGNDDSYEIIIPFFEPNLYYIAAATAVAMNAITPQHKWIPVL